MSDQNGADDPTTPGAAASGGFDWLIESHQQSVPMAPLTDDIPSPTPAPFTFERVPPPAVPLSPPPTLTAPSAPTLLSTAPPPLPIPSAMPMPAAAQTAPPAPPPVSAAAAIPESAVGPALATAPPPTAQGFPLLFTDTPTPDPAPTPGPSEATSTRLPPFTSEPSAPTMFGRGGAGGFTLERHRPTSRSGNGPLDWVAFVLAFLAPPVGLLLGIGVAVVDSRNKGYVASIAKAAIGIGAGLTLVLGVALVVNAKITADQAAHDSIVVSARGYCSKLTANPTTLTSDTFGWPAPADTVPDSLSAIQAYTNNWKALVKLAPAGVLADTQKVESTAASIASSVQSTQTLDDASNVAQMQNVIATTGIKSWVSEYCT